MGEANGRANAALLAQTPARDGRPQAVYRSAASGRAVDLPLDPGLVPPA